MNDQTALPFEASAAPASAPMDMPAPLVSPTPMSPMPRALESAALASVIAERLAQIDKHGHDPQRDAAQAPDRLLHLAKDYCQIAAERAQRGKNQHLSAARKKAVQSAALAIAAIEVIDAICDHQST